MVNSSLMKLSQKVDTMFLFWDVVYVAVCIVDEMEPGVAEVTTRPLVAAAAAADDDDDDDDDEAETRSRDEMDSASDHSPVDHHQQQMMTTDAVSDKSPG